MSQSNPWACWDNTAIVIPVFNAAATLPELLWGVLAFVDAKQVICVDDGSEDDSVEICQDHGVQVHEMKVNRGKGAALKAGFNLAMQQGFEFAMTLDSDMQHHPDQMVRFIAVQNRTEADLVIGKRDFRFGTMPIARIASNTITSVIVSLMCRQRVCDSQSGYRLYRLEHLKQCVLRTDRYQFESEVIFEYARKDGVIAHVPIGTIYNDQPSNIRHLRDIMNFIGVVIHEGTKKGSIH